jgi:HAE1 family hydrophobic/amphiphilic exporter-1
MMLSQASGSESMRGLATVVVFGLTLSTLVTLLLVPAVYLGFRNIQDRSRKRKENRQAKKAKANA